MLENVSPEDVSAGSVTGNGAFTHERAQRFHLLFLSLQEVFG